MSRRLLHSSKYFKRQYRVNLQHEVMSEVFESEKAFRSNEWQVVSDNTRADKLQTILFLS